LGLRSLAARTISIFFIFESYLTLNTKSSKKCQQK
jgi:hypothetical protein